MMQAIETKSETGDCALTANQLRALAPASIRTSSMLATPTPTARLTQGGGHRPSVVSPLAPTPFRNWGGLEK